MDGWKMDGCVCVLNSWKESLFCGTTLPRHPDGGTCTNNWPYIVFKSFSSRLSTSGPSHLTCSPFRLQVTSCCRSCSSGGLTGPRVEAEEEAACREVRAVDKNKIKNIAAFWGTIKLIQYEVADYNPGCLPHWPCDLQALPGVPWRRSCWLSLRWWSCWTRSESSTPGTRSCAGSGTNAPSWTRSTPRSCR